MARKKKLIPDYGTITIKGIEYYRTRITDADGKSVSLYALTPEDLFEKVLDAQQQIKEAKFRRANPTVKEYSEKWLLMKSPTIRATTRKDYASLIKNYIVAPLGDKYMSEITADDVKIAMIPAAKLSECTYQRLHMLYKAIFASAEESNVIDRSPCERLSSKGGKPQKRREALSDDQVQKLLEATEGLQVKVFIMIGLYAGLRREEILALQWDCVYLDVPAPYLSVQRAWHVEHNRPVILDQLKTNASRRNVPLPPQLLECLKEVKANSNSKFVIANKDGDALSGTQFKRMWDYVKTRTVQDRTYVRYKDGKKVVHQVKPVLGKKAAHNSHVVYSLDFNVTPHQLRHTYITNLIHASVDPKTVQYLAGHENSKITMDIYAKVKYNKPEQLASVINAAFEQPA